MSKKVTAIGTVIGRMNLPHKGHKHLITTALNKSDYVVVVLGSAHQARTPKNPFKAEEREAMIRAMFSPELNSRLLFTAVRDYKYSNNDWIAAVRGAVSKTVKAHVSGNYEVTLFSYVKDKTTHYVKWFPEWKGGRVEPFFFDGKLVNATDIRDHLYNNLSVWARPGDNIDRFRGQIVPWMVDDRTIVEIQKVCYEHHDAFKRLVEWYNHDKNYIKDWGPGPHITGDPVVFCNARVLLIRRASRRGYGLLALPGGHLDQGERIVDCIFRELTEESKIDVPPGKLRNSLKRIELFDAVDRSECARVITHAGIIVLDDEQTLPKAKGKLDKEEVLEVLWVPFEQLPYLEDQFFEDHFYIVDAARKLVSKPN